MRIIVALSLIVVGLQYISGKTRVFRIPIDFGEYSSLVGLACLLIASILIASAFSRKAK